MRPLPGSYMCEIVSLPKDPTVSHTCERERGCRTPEPVTSRYQQAFLLTILKEEYPFGEMLTRPPVQFNEEDGVGALSNKTHHSRVQTQHGTVSGPVSIGLAWDHRGFGQKIRAWYCCVRDGRWVRIGGCNVQLLLVYIVVPSIPYRGRDGYANWPLNARQPATHLCGQAMAHGAYLHARQYVHNDIVPVTAVVRSILDRTKAVDLRSGRFSTYLVVH